MNKIDLPITLNPVKHHFHYLLNKIEKWKNQEWEIVHREMLNIGDNLLDFYIGTLTVEQIYYECNTYFQENKINDKTGFINWLGNHEYKKITLNDTSVWIVKRGIRNEQYIHIHPAKKSPFSIRIRAITLKTVVALQIHSIKIKKEKMGNLEKVNYIRENFLNLSPVKSLHRDKGILKIWRFFENNS